jgi:hypothetical protein
MTDEPKFDKFGWLQKLSADPRLSAQQRQLGTVIGTKYTWKNGKGWAVELAELATASGYKNLRTVSPVLRKLCKAGYLVETYRRSTGPGLPAKASYDLRHPVNTDINTDTGNGKHRHSTPTLADPNTDTRECNTDSLECNTDTLECNTDIPHCRQTPPEQQKEGTQGVLSGNPSGVPCLVSNVTLEDQEGGPLEAVPEKKHGEEIAALIAKHEEDTAALIAKGKAIFENGKYAPKQPPMDLGPWG